ncbi:MAG: alpha/beta hydrolase family protein [Steroidobacterales bacterium]
MRLTRILMALISALTLASAVVTAESVDAPDPVRNDPSASLNPPAWLDEIAIRTHGVRLNGLVLVAAGTGPHPMLISLHGFPGTERNLDLAQVVRRAGYNVLFFDYRGVFGSGGNFSFANSLEDTAAVLAWARSPDNVAKYHTDPQRLAILGHSFGGWLALMSGAQLPPRACVAALAAWNVGWAAKRFADHPKERIDDLNDLRTSTQETSGPVRANADALHAQMTAHAREWDYVTQAGALRNRSLLLVAASRDTPDENAERHEELAAAIHAAGGTQVQTVNFDDDHQFSSHRIALADTLVHWLQGDCARSQGANAAP